MTVSTTVKQPWTVLAAARIGLHYGWIVVAVTGLALLVSAGLRQAPAVLMLPLEAEFGWNRAMVSLAVSVSLICYGLGGPFSGRLIDQYGPRGVMLGALALTLVGTAGMLVLTTYVELIFWWGLLVGSASGALALVMGATVANRWFVAKRGLVTGIFGAATSAGQLIFVPVMMALTLAFDWRIALGLMASLLGLVVIPAAIAIMRNQPADVGLEGYGATPENSQAGAAGEAVIPLPEALRTGDFWLLAASFFVCGFTTFGLIGTHLVPHALEHGFSEPVAAGALALLGATNVIGTMISGVLTDRYNPRHLLGIYYALRALSLLILPAVSEPIGLTIFAILFGLDYIATVPPTVALTADRFGRRSIGTVFGWIFFSHQVGAAVASLGAGVVRVWLGDYTLAFLLAGTLGFVAAGLSLRTALPRQPVPATT